MKLYFHPASTTSRMVTMFAAEQAISLDYQVIDLFTGEHLKPEFAKINPSCLVPVLEDGDFRLCESSAILKYLGDRANSPAYPKDPKARARVHEVMDWLYSNFYKDFGYGLVYPQLFPHHKRRSDEAQSATLDWGRTKSQVWLKILDQSLIGPNKSWLCGSEITLADYVGAEMICAGEVIGCSFAAWPNISRWLRNMKSLKSWPRVHEVIDGFAASMKGKTFVTV